MAAAAYTAPILTGRRLSSERVAAIQREKILAGAVDALDELGYERVTVAAIIGRARVSRGAFYDQFADRDECFAAVLDDAVARIEEELAEAGVQRLAWRDQLRTGVAVVLDFLDRHRALARGLFIESHRAGAQLQQRRGAVLARIAAFMDRGETAQRFAGVTGEALAGSAYAVVHRRLLRGDGQPLLPIAEELANTLLLPYGDDGAAPSRRARRKRRERLAAAA